MGLRELLTVIEQTPVSVGFLKKRVPSTVKVITYQQLRGKHRSAIFKNLTGIVVLIPKKGSKMGHFITLIPRKNHIEYFSSLGNSPQFELNIQNEPLKIFQELLGKNFIYNRVKLQSGKYSVQTCAAWCIARVKLAKLKLREFVQLFRKIQLSSPDDIVSMMCLLDFIG